ncbi:hypothetical protein EXIGLDRAFT_758190 [Exidia glandulosa HHB12029]|uniref:Uncharacterized protein n=1 Tax=Exidia glandulosa HHB12029 TaxID=1314781 RepID=A0A166BTF7_EXIGL|nr:hypothetical protein EXIGLDRAFT_758190 [Exidia glandulosa HHB12029]
MATTTTLPSFVELMATLGLDNEVRPKGHRTTASFSSVSSSSSATSSLRSATALSTPQTSPPLPHFPSPPSPSRSLDADRRASLGRKRAARFSPYSQDTSHTRRISLPSAPHEVSSDSVQTMRSAPTSPRSRSPLCPETGDGVSRSSPSRSDDSDAPLPRISAMYRTRRTPSASPRSATFHKRSRSRTQSSSSSPDQLLIPVALPTLPISIMSPASATSSNQDNLLRFGPSSADDSQSMSIAQRRHHPRGLRISTFRSSARAQAGMARDNRVPPPIRSAPGP